METYRRFASPEQNISVRTLNLTTRPKGANRASGSLRRSTAQGEEVTSTAQLSSDNWTAVMQLCVKFTYRLTYFSCDVKGLK